MKNSGTPTLSNSTQLPSKYQIGEFMRHNVTSFLSLIALAACPCAHGGPGPDAVSSRAEDDDGLRQAFERTVYSLHDSGEGRYRGRNPAQRLSLEFNPREVRLNHPQGDVSFRLLGYGYGQRLRAPGQPKLVGSGQRVEYRRNKLTEWYVNGAQGLEQG